MDSFTKRGSFYLPCFKLYNFNSIPFAVFTGDNKDKIAVDLFCYIRRTQFSEIHALLDHYERLNTYLYDTALFRVVNQNGIDNVTKMYVAHNNVPPQDSILIPSGDYLHPSYTRKDKYPHLSINTKSL